MTPATKHAMRKIARELHVALAAPTLAYDRAIRDIMEALNESFVHTLITHRKLRTGMLDAAHDPLGWMTLSTAGAHIEIHYLAQVASKVTPAFNKMAARVSVVTRPIAELQGINPNASFSLLIAAAREANIRLVEDAGRKYAADVRAVFEDPANYDLGVDALRDLLVARGSVSVSHADLIARDQVLKLSADMNEARQRAAGVEEYTWSGIMDERERPSHVALEGNRYAWGAPTPIGYTPGKDYQCRCIAIAYVPELEGL